MDSISRYVHQDFAAVSFRHGLVVVSLFLHERSSEDVCAQVYSECSHHGWPDFSHSLGWTVFLHLCLVLCTSSVLGELQHAS